MGWAPGDRVQLSLPDDANRWRRPSIVTGTVIEVDPPGLGSGVRVQLDRFINGVDNCFATHEELSKATPSDQAGGAS